MIATGAFKVHSSFVPPHSLFLWGTRENGAPLDSAELRNQLFAWHAPSFYGTFIETMEWGKQSGVVLPASMALDYFCDTTPLQHTLLQWGDELTELRTHSPAIRDALLNGRCMPDYEKWIKGSLGWKLQLTGVDSKNAKRKAIGELDTQSSGDAGDAGSTVDTRDAEGSGDAGRAVDSGDAGDKGDAEGSADAGLIAESVSMPLDEFVSPLAKKWMDSLISEWVRERPEFKQALVRLEQAHPLPEPGQLPAAKLWLDEEDWLVAIGWNQDSSPFRTCLQLVEPADGREWRLQIVLQDRHAADLQYACSQDAQPADGTSLPAAWHADLARVGKDVQRWLHILPWLRKPPARLREEISHDEAWEILAQGSLRLVEAGYAVFLPAWWERLKQTRPRLKAKIKSSVGAAQDTMFGLGQLMQFDWHLAIGDVEMSEIEFKELTEQKRKLIQFRGKWIILDPAQLTQIQEAMKKMNKKKGLSLRDVLEMHVTSMDSENEIPDIPALETNLHIEIELNEQLHNLMAQLNHQEAIQLVESPIEFQGTLRHYQTEGVAWLLFLRQFGLGGCLADDMGLGKTIQWITYLLCVKERDPLVRPSLLICPTSVLGNWQKELQRFAPHLKVHLHYGNQRYKNEKFTTTVTAADIVLTTYTLSHLDQKELTSFEWGSICLDEAQNIKNAYTKQASSIRQFTGGHRIAMTGTPIENRLTELWSIFDFLNPGYLGTLREFTQHFVTQIEKTRDEATIAKVKKLIRPFLLRRVKKDPLIQLDLPDKNEYKTYISLTSEQASLYENYIQDMFTRLEKRNAMERRGLILAALTKLKQLCNHPSLLLKEGLGTPWQDRSNKVERLLEMVTELREEGHRCLIFTQYVETGHLLQAILQKELGEKVQFLHGGTTKINRDRLIENFQEESEITEESFGIFILSLKAGGIGLNLTAANHVFHFDRWWNPAVENQATDRAYRIGQKRQVQVHKFVTLGTLEERIDEMIDRKQGLSQQIVGTGEKWITELSTDDLKELFTLRREMSET